MKNYRFLIEQPGQFTFTFLVSANSAEEAVKMVNESETESMEGEHLHLSEPFHHAYFVIGDEFKVDASMIVEETSSDHALPTKVVDYLVSQGYDYDLNEVENLLHDEEPGFSKYLETIDGGIYAFLKVTAHYEHNIQDWSFRMKAHLYPLSNARMVEGDGGARYRVDLQDGQLFTTFEELTKILEIYENKFMDLIYILREADPKDGLPL